MESRNVECLKQHDTTVKGGVTFRYGRIGWYEDRRCSLKVRRLSFLLHCVVVWNERSVGPWLRYVGNK